MAQVGSIRGLSQYIKKIRAASTQEERENIVFKELAKIRQKYSSQKKVSAYDRKKYTWKLLYSHMMGFEVDFGHKHAADLIPSERFDEKQVGYQALTILLNENDQFMMLPVNNVLKDLTSNNELFINLALSFAGSVAGAEMSAAIVQPVTEVLLNGQLSEHCRKKAALCLARIFRKLPPEANVISPEEWCPHFRALIGNPFSPGPQLAIMGLVTTVLERSTEGYEQLQGLIVQALAATVTGRGVRKDYLYYGIPCPWLQCKQLRALMCFQQHPDEEASVQLMSLLNHLFSQALPSGKDNQNLLYARTAILAEAVRLSQFMESKALLSIALSKITSLLDRRDANGRYVALETLATVSTAPDIAAALRPHLPLVSACLVDADPSVRRRAVDVLVSVCDAHSVAAIVAQLLELMPRASPEARGDLVVKIAVLAERFPPSLRWYIDTLLALMDAGGEEVGDDVWHRVVHLLSNSEQMRARGTAALVAHLHGGTHSVPLIATAGYVLSEFADEVTEREPLELAEALIARFDDVPPAAQALLLTAVLKLRMHALDDGALRARAHALFKEHARSPDVELQQRASEYLAMSELGQESIVMRETVLAPMPDWPEQGLVVVAAEEEEDGEGEAAAAAPAHSGGSGAGTLAAGSGDVDDAGSASPRGAPAAEAAPGSPERAAAVAAPPPPSPANLLDLSTPPPPDRERAAADAARRESGGGASASAAPPQPLQPPSTLNDAAAPAAAANAARMLYSGKGVLLEDAWLQVGLVAKPAGHAQALMLYCGNKSTNMPLDSFAIAVAGHPCFATACAPPPHILLPQQQVLVSATATLLPGAAASLAAAAPPPPPTAVVSYAAGGKVHRCAVTLPLAVPLFARPHHSLTQPWFFGSWAAAAADSASRAVVLTRLPAPVASGAALAAHMGQLGFWDGGVRLDPTSALNYAGAALALGVDVLTRVEVNPRDPAQVNITVVVTQPVPHLAMAFRDWLQAGLAFLAAPA